MWNSTVVRGQVRLLSATKDRSPCPETTLNSCILHHAIPLISRFLFFNFFYWVAPSYWTVSVEEPSLGPRKLESLHHCSNFVRRCSAQAHQRVELECSFKWALLLYHPFFFRYSWVSTISTDNVVVLAWQSRMISKTRRSADKKEFKSLLLRLIRNELVTPRKGIIGWSTSAHSSQSVAPMSSGLA